MDRFTPETFKKFIKKAINKKRILVLYGHNIASKTQPLTTRIDTLEEIIRIADEKDLRFYQVKDLLSEPKQQCLTNTKPRR